MLIFQKKTLYLPLLVFGAFADKAESAPIIALQFVSSNVVAGGSGNLSIRFKISNGFKIPKQPSPKIQLNSSTDLEIRGDLGLQEEGTGRDPEYFNGLKPLSVELVSSANVQRGQHWLEGKFTYFFCSDKDKYCSRSVENLRIPIEVTDRE